MPQRLAARLPLTAAAHLREPARGDAGGAPRVVARETLDNRELAGPRSGQMEPRAPVHLGHPRRRAFRELACCHKLQVTCYKLPVASYTAASGFESLPHGV